jgi:predicted esterase
MNTTTALLMVPLVTAALPSQKGLGQGDLKTIPVKETGYEGMVYHLFTPKGVRPGKLYPLVYALHGNGQNAETHARSIAKISTAELPVFVVAPQYQKEKKFNAPVYPGAGEIFAMILRTTLKDCPIDKGRVILEGFSMGSNYSTAWINALANRTKQDNPFPFRAAWLNSTAVPPRSPAPRIPYLLFVGEKETAVLGRINVLESVRTAYKSMFIADLDVRYIEIPGMGHAVNAECRRIMREHLAAMPDHTGAVPIKLARLFPIVQDLCASGRFDKALAELDGVVATGTIDRKSKARTLSSKISGYVKKFISATERKRHATIADYRELARLKATLADVKTFDQALKSALQRLARNRQFLPEFTAWEEFTAGQKLAAKNWKQSVAAIKSIADGPHKDTCYGHRARAHMQAIGKN